MKRKITLSDIAKKLNITPSTVSRALDDSPRISESTKKAVRKVVKELNYQPNNIASALRKGKSNTIGVIVPTSDRQFFASIISGIDEVIHSEGYNIIICQSDEKTSKEKENIQELLRVQVAGIIASVAKETTEYSHFLEISERGVPLVLYDRIGESLKTDAVVNNDYKGAYKAVTHLVEQGCKNIAHFAGQQHIGIYKDRLNGYIDALKEHDLSVDEALIIKSDLINDTSLIIDSGIKMAQKLIKMENRPDGIFSSSDFAAIGALNELKKHNISIPEEIALVGYSNDFSASIVNPSLTSVDQHTKRMGNIAAELFLNQINAEESDYKYNIKNIEPDLVIRESSMRKQED